MFWLYIQRIATMGVLCTSSVIVIGTSVHYVVTELNETLFVDGIQVLPVDTPDTLALLNVAVAALTILTVPVMLTIDLLRRGAFTSLVVVEVCWLGLLAIVWIAAASFTTTSITNLIQLCNVSTNRDVSTLQALCTDSRVSAAFGFIAWLSLVGYVIILLVMSVMSQSKGAPVWKSTVKDGKFVANAAVAHKITAAAVSYISEATPMKDDMDVSNMGVFTNVTQHLGFGGQTHGQGQGQGHQQQQPQGHQQQQQGQQQQQSYPMTQTYTPPQPQQQHTNVQAQVHQQTYAPHQPQQPQFVAQSQAYPPAQGQGQPHLQPQQTYVPLQAPHQIAQGFPSQQQQQSQGYTHTSSSVPLIPPPAASTHAPPAAGVGEAASYFNQQGPTSVSGHGHSV